MSDLVTLGNLSISLLGAAYRELKMSESFSLHLDKPLLKIVPGITSKQKKKEKKPTYR